MPANTNECVHMKKQDVASSYSFPKVNSRAFGISLYKEANTVSASMVTQRFNERRKLPRFQPDTKLFILHSTLGTITDIGIGGLSYTYYLLPNESSKRLPKTATIFSADKDTLVDLPCIVVDDVVLRESYSFFPELKQRQVNFTDLTEKQLLGLEQFILQHAMVFTFDFEEKIHSTTTAKFDHAS